MVTINKQKYLVELSNLISFMSDRDRARVIEELSQKFDESEDESALIAELGTPTKLAITMARTYVATPEELIETELPEEPAAASGSAEPEQVTAAAQDAPSESADTQKDVSLNEVLPEKQADSSVENAPKPAIPVMEDIVLTPEETAPKEKEKKEKVKKTNDKSYTTRPAGTFFFVLLTILIGVPVAVVLICIGIPILAAGLGVAGGAVWLAVTLTGMFTMLSDILLVDGAALVAAAVGILLALVGLTISIALGRLWIGGALCGLGRKMCRKEKKEATEQ